MNLQDFIDFGADILNNFSRIPILIFETEILGTPLWVIILGSGLAVYLSWIIIKFAIGI